MIKYLKISLILFMVSACTTNENKNHITVIDSIPDERVSKTEKGNKVEGEPNISKEDFVTYIGNFKNIDLPYSINVDSLSEESYPKINNTFQNKYIMPYTGKISENDFPYAFNYPDFSEENYRYLGKVKINSDVSIAFIYLPTGDYSFAGGIAYDSKGNILDGIILGEEEGGSEMRANLESSIEKNGNSINITSNFQEKQYNQDGTTTIQNAIKVKYKFNLITYQFEVI